MKGSRLYNTWLWHVLLSFIITGVPLSHFIVNRPQRGLIIQISRFELHHAVQAPDSPRPSEPSINRNVGWLWSHNNMREVLLFKIISQWALPNSWATSDGQYVSGDFVLFRQVVAESIRPFVIKQRLKMLHDALIVQRKPPVEWTPIWWKLCCLRPLTHCFGEWCHAVYTTFYCRSSFPVVFRLCREVRPKQSE